jgi:GT2 family glycosyltransferase
MAEPLVTIVVVPRERFSFALSSLDAVYERTSFPFRLVYVDAGSPQAVRWALQRRAADRGFELLRVDRYLTPNASRNLGLGRVRTRYVVFIDNDGLVMPGWLTALVGCAEETGAAVCGPLQLIGDPEKEVIHLAGGTAGIVERDGRRRFDATHNLTGRRVSEVRERLARGPTDEIEFHCMLVRAEVFERLGPLDEDLLNTQEHSDLCLKIREAGLSVVFEPASVVSYVPPPPFALSDIPYFLLRWSEEWTRSSLEHFVDRWRLDPTDPGLESTLAFVRWHRRLPARHARALCERAIGAPIDRWKGWLMPLERGATRTIERWTRFAGRRAAR